MQRTLASSLPAQDSSLEMGKAVLVLTLADTATKAPDGGSCGSSSPGSIASSGMAESQAN